MKVVYLALGSNLGDREAMLRAALEKLHGPDLRLLRASSVMETEPVGFREQGRFLNMVAEFETDLFPRRLLQRTQRVERELGRKRAVLNGPRTIDIDIVFYGSATIQVDDLTVPHPRYHDRRFVLEPLAELNPGLRDPVTGRTVAEMLASLRDASLASSVGRRSKLI